MARPERVAPHRMIEGMVDYASLLRHNRNYRYMWLGQVVSEIGDYFNNIAVFSLVMEVTGSGLVVSGVMLSRAIPAVLAGPAAGVVLDRFDRRRIMLASDLIRAVVALGFIVTVRHPSAWLLYTLSGLLMFASPFFTSGRTAILPAITTPEELHTANSLTQNTQSATLTVGSMLAGFAVARLGFGWAFVINSVSFLFSAYAVWKLRVPGGFVAESGKSPGSGMLQPWHEYVEGLNYFRATPLVFWIGMISVGWACGGGAAQILFTLFGEQVFHRGATGIGAFWGFAGIGLLVGGWLGHIVGRRVDFAGYKRSVSISYISHGVAYVMFSLMPSYALALVFIGLSRVGMAVTSVLNYSQLLHHIPDRFRGRVFSTMESLRWAVMILSMALAGVCSIYFSPRAIGVVAGILGGMTAVVWTWADWSGRIPEPAEELVAVEEAEAPQEPGA